MTSRRTRLLTILGAGCALATALAIVVVLARGWAEGDGGSYASGTTVAATLDPPSALFGDAVTATVRLVVDTREVDPASVAFDPSFKPFQAFDESRAVISGIGHAAEVVLRYRIQCVTGTCLLAMEREETGGRLRTGPITLPAATATARDRDGRAVRIPVTWPTLVVHSRLTAEDIEEGAPAEVAFAPPAVSYSIAPGTFGWLLVGGACLFLIAGGWLVTSVLLARRRERVLRLPDHLTPTERALALTRHALGVGDVAGGRKALERLASELDREGRGELAQTAGRLAWSEIAPSAVAVEDLARSVGSGANGR